MSPLCPPRRMRFAGSRMEGTFRVTLGSLADTVCQSRNPARSMVFGLSQRNSHVSGTSTNFLASVLCLSQLLSTSHGGGPSSAKVGVRAMVSRSMEPNSLGCGASVNSPAELVSAIPGRRLIIGMPMITPPSQWFESTGTPLIDPPLGACRSVQGISRGLSHPFSWQSLTLSESSWGGSHWEVKPSVACPRQSGPERELPVWVGRESQSVDYPRSRTLPPQDRLRDQVGHPDLSKPPVPLSLPPEAGYWHRGEQDTCL